MVFTVIEWFALVFAVLAIVKLITISINAKSWITFAGKLYSSPVALTVVELILAAVLFYYLLMELTIVQIFAAVTLGALLTGISFAMMGKETLTWGKSLLKKGSMMKKWWLSILIWLVLSIWVLIEILA